MFDPDPSDRSQTLPIGLVTFKDITPLLREPAAFRAAIDALASILGSSG